MENLSSVADPERKREIESTSVGRFLVHARSLYEQNEAALDLSLACLACPVRRQSPRRATVRPSLMQVCNKTASEKSHAASEKRTEPYNTPSMESLRDEAPQRAV